MIPDANKQTLLVLLAPFLLIGLLVGVLWFRPANPPTTSPTATTGFSTPPGSKVGKRGRELYQTHCSSCHGSKGRGNGPAAQFLNPNPLNFHSSRAANMTNEEMMTAIMEGMPSTGMPAWEGRLSKQQIRWVVGYVREEFVRSGEADPPGASSDSSGSPSSR